MRAFSPESLVAKKITPAGWPRGLVVSIIDCARILCAAVISRGRLLDVVAGFPLLGPLFRTDLATTTGLGHNSILVRKRL
jgi:hypothetical protein